jgi:2-polyprenyl-6-methoxyphenol hydroxylase-like FAD-dependent oxidoreductase
MQAAGERHGYPLVAVYASRFVGPRFALIGDAAVGMHPVTAHGYNFGLYGVGVLSREIARAGGDPANPAALAAYESEHRRTTLPIYLGTNAIVRLYTDESRGARYLRGAVLRVARGLPPVRKLITRQLTGTTAA